MSRLAVQIVFIASIAGCDARSAVTVGQEPALYRTAEDCTVEQHIRTGSRLSGSARILRRLEPGSVVEITGEKYSKDFLCYRVEYQHTAGFMLPDDLQLRK